jgi:Tfp pilus assembly protein PilN
MIEINLLPGARKKKGSSKSASLNLGAVFGDLASKLKDPWLAIAIVGVVIGLSASGAMYVFQSREAATLEEQQRVAVQDSTRYAAVLAQRAAATSQRDSIMRQIAVISAIDGDRFIWPHVMDEVARALPTYTWLRSVTQTSSSAPISPEAAAAGNAPRLGLRIVAYTVDIQAVTIYMKNLEASPFLENVTLGVSDKAVTDGKEVTQFTLDMQYSKPDGSAIRTVPLSIAVR